MPGLSGLDQGSSDHTGGWRHPIAERGAPAAARSVCVPAPRALVQGRALTGQAPRKSGYGHFSREHRRHLRRHRIRSRKRRLQEVPGSVQAKFPEAIHQDPFSRHLRHRAQSRVQGRDRAAVPRCSGVRHREQAQERDHRAQGQHHEIHGRCISELELRPGRARVSRARVHLGAMGAHQIREGREGRERTDGRGEEVGQSHHQGCDRRHHVATDTDAAR